MRTALSICVRKIAAQGFDDVSSGGHCLGDGAPVVVPMQHGRPREVRAETPQTLSLSICCPAAIVEDDPRSLIPNKSSSLNDPNDPSQQKAETVVDPCASAPCQNGGHCLDDGAGGYSCSCPPLFEGAKCQTRTDPCLGDPCDGTKCIPAPSTALGYYCECEDCKKEEAGWFGRRLMAEFEHRAKRRRLGKYGYTPDTTDVPAALSYKWRAGQTMPGTVAMPKDILHFGGVDAISPQCHVYQNGENLGSEITLSVKCPRNSAGDEVDCEDIMGKLTSLRKSAAMKQVLLEN